MNPATSNTPASVLEIDPEAAVRLLAEGALLLDVREPDEWAVGLPVIGADGRPGAIA